MRITGQRGTSGAVAGQHVQHTLRKTGLFKQACDHRTTAHRRARVRLEHHGIAESDGRGHCAHRQIQREIER
ncbi:hypothetical protein D3C71_2069120 [compost metagenome]